MTVDQLFNSFIDKNILVIGDVMIDAYINGKVNRVSPEAPVPIVSLSSREDRLGGAANVALNLKALGANPILCTVIGNDDNTTRFNSLLKEQELSSKGIVNSDDRITTVKTRIIGNYQQLLRVDNEQTNEISKIEEQTLISQIRGLIEKGVDAIIFEDYNKGILTESLINEITTLANSKNIPTTVDPKKHNFLSFKNVTLFKPNLKELKEGLNLTFDISNKQAFEDAVSELESHLKCKNTFVTLSEHGVFIKDNSNKHYIPAHVRNIADVSGAGDTVISVATLCLVAGLDIKLIAEVANLAGGLVCEYVGVISIKKEQLKQEVAKILN